MTLEKLITGIREMGLDVAYGRFAEGDVPKFPYVIIQGAGSSPFIADGIVYHESEDMTLELYCEKKDPVIEKRMSDFLTDNELLYEKDEIFDEKEKLILIKYEI